ncbi:MAG: hypothetical protein AAF362_12360 [Pseudomonadota bacterium]
MKTFDFDGMPDGVDIAIGYMSSSALSDNSNIGSSGMLQPKSGIFAKHKVENFCIDETN